MQTSEFQSAATIEQPGAAIVQDTLPAQARQAIGAAYSDNTRRACVGGWDRFSHAVGPSRSMPASPEVIANYLGAAGRRGEVGGYGPPGRRRNQHRAQGRRRG